MKKYIIYIGLPLFGLLLGWVIFGGGTQGEDTSIKAHNHVEEDQIWTCSMHPQIRQPEPGDCPICGMDLIPLDENANQNELVFSMSEDAVRLANIQTTIVGSGGNHAQGISLSGRIEADETASSSVVTHIPGRIEKLYIGFTGENVRRGQRVAKMYSSDYITAQRELLEAYKVKDVSPSLLKAAKNKLRYWKISDEEINGIIERNRVNEYIDIRSEYSGVVHRKLVSVGDHLGQGQALFELQNLGKLWAVFDAYESQLNAIELGETITFTTPSVAGEEFSSKVDFIDPVINPNSRTARIRMEVNNAKGRLKPEMFIRGNIEGDLSAQEVLTVPKSAVLWTGTRSVVYVKVPDVMVPTFEYREIELGKSTGENYEIVEGLKSGEEVVTNGAFVIDASAQLNNQSSMMNKNLLESSQSKPSSEPAEKFEANEAFLHQLANVTEKYILIKDALVADNSKKAKMAAKEMLSALKGVDMKLLDDQAHIFWMKKIKTLKESLNKMLESGKIDAQRISFGVLSQNYIQVMQTFGSNSQDLYVQECTMAFDNKGARWLSTERKIFNPYYGADMLNCGSVIDSIRKENNDKADHSGHAH